MGLGVVSEVAVFLLMPKIMARARLETLMLLSLLAAVLRFALIAAAAELAWVAIGAQLLHALTFGLHHAASVGLIHRMFDQHHHGRAQGLYIIASFGVGGSAGGLIGGLVWPHGGMATTFAMSTAAAALGVLLCWRWLRPAAPVQAG